MPTITTVRDLGDAVCTGRNGTYAIGALSARIMELKDGSQSVDLVAFSSKKKVLLNAGIFDVNADVFADLCISFLATYCGNKSPAEPVEPRGFAADVERVFYDKELLYLLEAARVNLADGNQFEWTAGQMDLDDDYLRRLWRKLEKFMENKSPFGKSPTKQRAGRQKNQRRPLPSGTHCPDCGAVLQQTTTPEVTVTFGTVAVELWCDDCEKLWIQEHGDNAQGLYPAEEQPDPFDVELQNADDPAADALANKAVMEGER